ncbi:MAG: hypothetical protein K2M61_08650 [Muribaculaceae bacterium]|nr:hypothetical protein [Muribaculaceae bacterium]
MPDHIHFALFARDRLQYAIGSYIGMMKVKCGQQVRDIYPEIKAVFADDFHDRILRRYHKLDVIYNYIRQNPARWMLRQENPNFFRRKDNLEIDGQQWQAYGNMQLLDNPFKAPVVIHRADSKEILDAKKRRWAHLSENGGVLVSPFISAAEKEVRHYCEEVNGKLILLTNAPFADRQKPSVHDFMLCARGQLLIIAPLKALAPGRETFLFLNSVSEHIALNFDFWR